MTRFCNTHVGDRSIPELRARKQELEARDLSSKPGLQAELERVEFTLKFKLDALEAKREEPVYADVTELVESVTTKLKQPDRPCVECWIRETQLGQLVCDACLEAQRTAVPGIETEELDGRPIDVPEDPEDAPILKAVIEEFERRYREESERIAAFNELVPESNRAPRPRMVTVVKPSDAYKLGVADCIAYFRQLANGSTFEVQTIEVPLPAKDENASPDQA